MASLDEQHLGVAPPEGPGRVVSGDEHVRHGGALFVIERVPHGLHVRTHFALAGEAPVRPVGKVIKTKYYRLFGI